ncbi:MAG: hypothetical protein EXR75_08330, partial [Myxococcales bacterium]|nr:hypothetical protein [Myxococcales bacterium]
MGQFRVGFLAAVAALSAGLLVTPSHATECMSSEAKKTVAECPGGKFQANVTKRPQVSFTTAPEAIKKKDRT